MPPTSKRTIGRRRKLYARSRSCRRSPTRDGLASWSEFDGVQPSVHFVPRTDIQLSSKPLGCSAPHGLFPASRLRTRYGTMLLYSQYVGLIGNIATTP